MGGGEALTLMYCVYRASTLCSVLPSPSAVVDFEMLPTLIAEPKDFAFLELIPKNPDEPPVCLVSGRRMPGAARTGNQYAGDQGLRTGVF